MDMLGKTSGHSIWLLPNLEFELLLIPTIARETQIIFFHKCGQYILQNTIN